MKKTSLVLLIFLFTFCGQDKNNNIENSETDKTKFQKKDSVNKINSEKLRLIYNAYDLETDSSTYTYELNNRIDSAKGYVLIYGTIIDIVNFENGYSLIVSSYHFNSSPFLLKSVIKTDKLLFKNLQSKLKREEVEGCFIVKVNSLNSLFPSIKAEKIDDNDSDLTFDLDEKVIQLNGELVDFYINI